MNKDEWIDECTKLSTRLTTDEVTACENLLKGMSPNESLDGLKSIKASPTTFFKRKTIREYIEMRRKMRDELMIANKDEILGYLTRVMRGETQSENIVIEQTGVGQSKAKIIKKSADEKEKLKSAELLAKAQGLFEKNINVNSTGLKVSIVEDLKD